MAGNLRSEWKWTVPDDETARAASHGDGRAEAPGYVRVLGLAVGPNGAAVVFDGDDVAIGVALN